MVTYQDIENANKTLATTDIKGKEYVQVNQRIKAFRMLYPQGTIATEIVSLIDGVVTMKATVLDGGVVLGVGHAQEKETSSYINKTSFIENCETSAVGRALGMCGLGVDASVASFEEVANAINNQNNKQQDNKVKSAAKSLSDRMFEKLEKLGISKAETMEIFCVEDWDNLTKERSLEIFNKMQEMASDERDF